MLASEPRDATLPGIPSRAIMPAEALCQAGYNVTIQTDNLSISSRRSPKITNCEDSGSLPDKLDFSSPYSAAGIRSSSGVGALAASPPRVQSAAEIRSSSGPPFPLAFSFSSPLKKASPRIPFIVYPYATVDVPLIAVLYRIFFLAQHQS